MYPEAVESVQKLKAGQKLTQFLLVQVAKVLLRPSNRTKYLVDEAGLSFKVLTVNCVQSMFSYTPDFLPGNFSET